MKTDRKLNDMQARFVDEYLIDMNATQAATRAGYSAKTASRIGPELLGKPWIQAAIAEKQKVISKRLSISQDRVLLERARLAFFDARKLLKDDGSPRPLGELDDDTAAAIQGIKVVRIGNSEMGVGEVLEYKIAVKDNSLTAIEKHLGMYAPEQHRTTVEFNDADGARLDYLLTRLKNEPR